MVKKTYLEIIHVQQSLSKPVLIGSDTAHDGKRKQFVFVPWEEEYRVMHGDREVCGGQAVEELLEAYNEL